MFSIVISLVSGVVFNPLFWLGYALCLLFPLPFVNSYIISLWSKFGSNIVSFFKGLVGKTSSEVSTLVSNTVSTIENDVVTTATVSVTNVTPISNSTTK